MRTAVALLLAFAGVVPTSPLVAQDGVATPRDTAVLRIERASLRHVAPASRSFSLVRPRDAYFLGGALATAAVTSLFDRQIAHESQRPQFKASRTLDHIAHTASSLGGGGPIALSAAMYAAGRVARDARLAAVGRESAEAVIASGALTFALKGLVGRQRPYAAQEDPDVYRLLHGFSSTSLASFPSGHTSGSFALATVLAAETATARPAVRWSVRTLGYGAATVVGLSRIYQDKHWASDVVAGAALGITSGLTVVRYARTHERMEVRPGATPPRLTLAPAPNGVALAWSFR